MSSGTVFRPALEGFPQIKSPQGDLLTKPFLEVCSLVLPVIDKFGSSMALVKLDIGGNITRLTTTYNTDPAAYAKVYDIVRKEVADKTAKGSSSCTNGLLWLTRAMDFLVELFKNLLVHEDWTMTQAANGAYVATLKKWHGWIAGAAFTVAMKLIPSRGKFLDQLGGQSAALDADIQKFVTQFGPVLSENHKFLQSVGMDDLTAS